MKNKMKGRGLITQKIKDESKSLLGYEIDVVELRLMPYIISVMMNSQKADPSKINHAERKILSKWRDSGHIEGGASGLSITNEFWEIISKIVWLGYVAYREDFEHENEGQ